MRKASGGDRVPMPLFPVKVAEAALFAEEDENVVGGDGVVVGGGVDEFQAEVSFFFVVGGMLDGKEAEGEIFLKLDVAQATTDERFGELHFVDVIFLGHAVGTEEAVEVGLRGEIFGIFLFGLDDFGDAHCLEDGFVEVGDGTDDDAGSTALLEDGNGEDGGADVLAEGDDVEVGVAQGEGAGSLLVVEVEADGVFDAVLVGIDFVGVFVDADDFIAHGGEALGERHAEISESDDDTFHGVYGFIR